MSEKSIPDIRFTDFSEEWKEKNIGDFYYFKNGLNKGKEFFGIGVPIVNFTDVFHNRGIYFKQLNGKVSLTDKEIKNYEVQQGDIFFTRTSETIKDIGRPSVMLDEPLDTVFSGFVLRGRAIDSDPLELKFKRYVFFTSGFREEMKKKSTMTTRALTSGTALKKMLFSYPNGKDEQFKIGSFFEILDENINIQQQLLNDHKQLKKAMLQKMFPQKGESVPRIRFAGYTSEWEIEPLSRLGKIMTGSTPSTLNKDNYSNEGILWITPTDIKGRIVTNTSRKISEMGETGARIAPAGTILVTSIASIGKNTLLLTRAGFNQQINSLTPNKNNDSYFLFTQSKIWSEKMKRVASSGIMQIVNKTEFSSIKTSIPQLEEQIKIGKIFKKLDETIELHEQKLETYQKLKKAMLQKMFV